MESVFEVNGDQVIPSRHAEGPWGATMHGGAAAALFAWQFERIAPESVHLARLSVEIFKPVPLEPVTITARTVRAGKRVAFVEAHLSLGSEVLSRAAGTFIRDDDVPLPPQVAGIVPALTAPGVLPDALPRLAIEGIGAFMAQLDLREVEGGLYRPGPASIWIRPTLPIVAGYENSPAMCVAAAADCESGVSALAYPHDLLYINPDLTITLARAAEGQWVNVTAVTHPTDRGHGVAEALLRDERGYIGRSAQTLFLDVPALAS